MNTITGLEHGTVNHSINFVCPETGNHTQGIESYWAQTKLKRMKGIHAVHLELYLEEKMWRDRNGGSKAEAFTNILKDLALRHI